MSDRGGPAGGARTVPVRSAWAGRGLVEKGDVLGPDNPLRTGTVRGPMPGPYFTVAARVISATRSSTFHSLPVKTFCTLPCASTTTVRRL